MRALTSTLAAVVLAAGASSIAACGGSSASRPLTRAELTRRANAICRRVIGEVNWLKVRPQDLPRVAGRLAALEERAAAELDRLTPPESMASEWRLIVDGFRLTGPEFRALGRQVSREGPQIFRVVPLSNAQHERGLEANVAHIEDCAKY